MKQLTQQEKRISDHKKGDNIFVTAAIIMVSAAVSATVLYNLIG